MDIVIIKLLATPLIIGSATLVGRRWGSTVNGVRHRYLVSFHSKVATMLPGDIILTGTPRAVKFNTVT
jgi:hypothetical protein